jgi:pimeloyl-ACP methyl ester carboxylesterase
MHGNDGITLKTEDSEVPTDSELAHSLAGDFRSEYVTVDGVRLHYVVGGQGRPLVLLPGWPQTWWEYHKVMPALAAAGRQVIAVDLPGMGSSDKPPTGYDKKAMAGVIHGFVRALGHESVDIAGHDIGAQVAFSFAANHPEATNRVALLDVVHPDESLYGIPMLPPPGAPFFPWWFAFNQVEGLPEELLAGRARYLVDWIFDNFLVNQGAVGESDRAVYAHAYNNADAIRGGSSWYRTFGQDIVDLGTYGKVTAPILGMVSNLGDGLFAEHMRATLPAQGADVRVVVVPDAGHYFVEEAPDAVIDEFNRFFV